MKKKIKDITIGEIVACCKKYDECSEECPYHDCLICCNPISDIAMNYGDVSLEDTLELEAEE